MVRPRRARPNSKELAFIIHGARAAQPELRALVEQARELGHVVLPRVTYDAGDAALYAREAAVAGVDAVVAVGGDGTVNEVVNGLSGLDVPLGILPLGTANDFARQVGIPDDPAAALDLVLRRRPRRIDTAELNGRRFLNVSSAGVGAEVTAETSSAAKDLLGPVAYAITGVRKLADLTVRRGRFSGPGFEHEGEFVFFAVGNGQATGGGTIVTPRASVVDGLLDLCLIEATSLGDIARLVLPVKRGEHLEREGVIYVQLPSVTITTDAPITVNVDGESATTDHLVYRARPRDLLLHVSHLPTVADDLDPEKAK